MSGNAKRIEELKHLGSFNKRLSADDESRIQH
jgi:hypothetical protein